MQMKLHARLTRVDFLLIFAIVILHFWPDFCPRHWFYTEWQTSFFEATPERHLIGKWKAYKLAFRPTMYEPIKGMGMTINSDGTCILENCYYSEFNSDIKMENLKIPITNGVWSIDVDSVNWEKRFHFDDASPNSKFGGYSTFWDYDMDGDYFIAWSEFEKTNETCGVYLFKENTNVPVNEKRHKPW